MILSLRTMDQMRIPPKVGSTGLQPKPTLQTLHPNDNPDLGDINKHEKTRMEKLLKHPEKLRGDQEKRNRDRYCRFHKDHGHNTSSCFKLKHQIEYFIEDG